MMDAATPRDKILIVDDTPVNLKLIRILLEAQGYEIRTAESAEAALEILDEFHPALLLLDVQLPGMNGLELTRLLRQNPQTRHLIIIAVTASAMKGDEEKALAAGFDGYITKPVDTRSLPSKIREFLQTERPHPPAAPVFSLPDVELNDLRRRFFEEGLRESRRMLEEAETNFDYFAAQRTLHQWVGVSSLLSDSEILERVQELQRILASPTGQNGGAVRAGIAGLVQQFARRLER